MSTSNNGGPAFARTYAEVERDRHALGMEPARTPYGHDGMYLRDYFIAHAPSEPQPWFAPVLPEKEAPVQPFKTQFPDCTEAEQGALNHFDSDYMSAKDVAEPRVRAYFLEREEHAARSRNYSAMALRELYVQWPAAWADAMLKARES